MKTLAEKIAVMQAYLDGKSIQINQIGYTMWEDVHKEPVFDWSRHDYRVTPTSREGWVNLYRRGFNLAAGNIHNTEKEALNYRPAEAYKTVKITWEE